MKDPESRREWHFLTSHAQVLLCIHRRPDLRIRDIAAIVGITERAAQRIVKDLVEAGYVTRERIGRRNEYALNTSAPMRHPAQRRQQVGDLLDALRLDGLDG